VNSGNFAYPRHCCNYYNYNNAMISKISGRNPSTASNEKKKRKRRNGSSTAPQQRKKRESKSSFFLYEER
jgi:hypothetical protein